jgi:hypothetical protein
MDHQNQIDLETLFNKNQLMKRLRAEFLVPEIIQHLEENEIPLDFGIDLLCQMSLHKRADVATLVGILRHHFDTLQECADMLLKAAQADLMDWHDLAQKFVLKIDVTDDVKADLERYQYPLPLVVAPKEVKTNTDTGYFTSKGSIILKQNHHEDDVCLDHINRVNRIKLRLNPDTALMVQNQWRHLDKPKECESQQEYQARKKAFEKYDSVSRQVMENILLLSEDGGFWLTHKYDKRGRTYAQGYHCNPQGNSWNKSLIEFWNQELVNG